MAMCDASYAFTKVDIGGSYGRDNDASVFAASEKGACLEDNTTGIPPPATMLEKATSSADERKPEATAGAYNAQVSSFLMSSHQRCRQFLLQCASAA